MHTPRTHFWTSLDPSAQETLRAGGRVRRFRSGEHLCYQGEPADHVLIIQDGWAKVCLADAEGRECVIAVRGPDELVGELGLLTDDPRMATITALHGVTALSVARNRFNGFLNEHPDAWSKVISTVSGRLVQDAERIMAHGTQFGASRLALFLLQLAEQSGRPSEDGGTLIPPLSQTELGSCVDASRETVARALKDWRGQGLVRTGWRQTVVLDPEGLRTVAAEG